MLNNQRNILLLCRSINDFKFVKNTNINSSKKYYLATDDIRLHREVAKYDWITKAVFIELEESFYSVADKVVEILDIINIWLKSLGSKRGRFPEDILFWIRHAEGGMTTQRIQDILMLIRSYVNLIDQFHIDSIVIISNSNFIWEDTVMVETARSRSIPINIITKNYFKVTLIKLCSFCKPFVYELYYLLNTLLIKLKFLLFHSDKLIRKNEIIIQICSTAPKHLIQHIALMKELKRKNYNPVALCWGVYSGTKQFKKNNISYDELENWVSVSALFSSMIKVFITLIIAKKKWKERQSAPALSYKSVTIGKLLWSSISFFICGELSQRYRLYIASSRYFKSNTPLAIKFWTLVFAEAVIPFKFISIKDTAIFQWASPVYHSSENPYEHHVISPDLILVSSPKQEKQINELGFHKGNIVSVGQLYKDNLETFSKKFTREQSYIHLSIPSTYCLYLLFDHGYLIRGYMSSSEQIRTIDYLLNFAKTHRSIALLVKPHPAHRSGILETQIRYFSLKNVFLIDSKMLPDHCMNVADLVITKFSTIGIEALYLNKPVVSLILDVEKRFRIFGDAADYFYNFEDLDNLLEKITSDKNYLIEWKSGHHQRAAKFLDDFILKTSKTSFELAAEAIDEMIKTKFNKNQN